MTATKRKPLRTGHRFAVPSRAPRETPLAQFNLPAESSRSRSSHGEDVGPEPVSPPPSEDRAG